MWLDEKAEGIAVEEQRRKQFFFSRLRTNYKKVESIFWS